jgi:hypothetical protein
MYCRRNSKYMLHTYIQYCLSSIEIPWRLPVDYMGYVAYIYYSYDSTWVVVGSYVGKDVLCCGASRGGEPKCKTFNCYGFRSSEIRTFFVPATTVSTKRADNKTRGNTYICTSHSLYNPPERNPRTTTKPHKQKLGKQNAPNQMGWEQNAMRTNATNDDNQPTRDNYQR